MINQTGPSNKFPEMQCHRLIGDHHLNFNDHHFHHHRLETFSKDFYIERTINECVKLMSLLVPYRLNECNAHKGTCKRKRMMVISVISALFEQIALFIRWTFAVKKKKREWLPRFPKKKKK